MHGVLFREFLRFAEDEFGSDVAGTLAGTTRYSAAASYDHGELLEIARVLGARTGSPPAEVLRRFGTALFHYFARMYPVFFAGAESTLGFLHRIDTYIHGELAGLYPGAEFPRFDVSRPSADRLEMVYRSERRLADLADGLIRGCAEHFGEAIEVQREDLPAGDEQTVRFVLLRPSQPAG